MLVLDARFRDAFFSDPVVATRAAPNIDLVTTEVRNEQTTQCPRRLIS